MQPQKNSRMEKYRIICHKIHIFVPLFWKWMENSVFSNGHLLSSGPDEDSVMPAGQETETAFLSRRA